jgi:hypothetical protein
MITEIFRQQDRYPVSGALLASLVTALFFGASAEQLPSWNDTDQRNAIIAFVESVTDETSTSYIPPDDRIATFDTDGTLWTEQSMYFQAIFALGRVREMAPENPQWKTEAPYASVLNNGYYITP